MVVGLGFWISARWWVLDLGVVVGLGFANLSVVGLGKPDLGVVGLGSSVLGLGSWVCRSRRGLAMVAWVL